MEHLINKHPSTDEELLDANTSKEVEASKEVETSKEVEESFTRKGVSYEEQVEAVNKYISINYLFYIILCVCIFILHYKKTNKCNYFIMVLSLIYSAFFSYLIHIIFHSLHYTKAYDDSSLIFKNIPIVDNCIHKITWFLDFLLKSNDSP